MTHPRVKLIPGILALGLIACGGCASLRDSGMLGSGSNAALEAAKLAQPQHAAAISQIQKVLRGAKAEADPIRIAVEAGWVYERTWYYQGQIVPASSVRFEDVLRKSSGPGETATALQTLGQAQDDALVAEVAKILEALEIETLEDEGGAK